VIDGGRSPADVKKALGNGNFIHDDLTKKDYRYIAKQGNVDETLLAVKPKDPRTGKGKVETAFPLSGPAVKRWISQLNGGNSGFIDAV
jgi:hypothetical protein